MVVVPVVLAVSVAVTALAPLMVAEAGMLQVTGLVAPVGMVVTAQLRLTVPVNPFDGVTLIVDVLVAP